MLRASFQPVLNRLFTVAVLILLSATLAWPRSYRVVHNFSNLAAFPSSGLITDAAGNAYGTAAGDGIHNAGVVYELSPKTGPQLVYAFHGRDGRFPQGNLIFDSDGNLYGTTVSGGNNTTACQTSFGNGCGVVFKLAPPSNGGLWTETVLYSFCSAANCADGAMPRAGVILDSTGNLYGTTANGGNQDCQVGGPGCGTVFELQPSQSGWTERVLYAFLGGGADGQDPLGSLVFDEAGNLYGTASVAGPGAGSAFRLSPSGGGWIFSVIYAFEQFSHKDGNTPAAGMIFDAAGNLYGTTAGGGESGFGTVFELMPSAGSWTEAILYSFAGGNDGATPESNLVFDPAGNLYGTTFAGGVPTGCLHNGCGTVFRLDPGAGGLWTESLFRFPLDGSLGAQPRAPLLLDPVGNIYGTTTAQGRFGRGVAFKIVQ